MTSIVIIVTNNSIDIHYYIIKVEYNVNEMIIIPYFKHSIQLIKVITNK